MLKDHETLMRERKINALQTELVGEHVYRKALRRLTALSVSVFSVVTAGVGLLAYFGLNDLAQRAVQPSVEAAQTAAIQASVSSDMARIEIDRLRAEVRELDVRLDEVAANAEKIQKLAAAQELVTSGDLRDLFRNSLLAVSSTTYLCSADEETPFETSLRLGFAAPYTLPSGRVEDSFALPDRNRQAGIVVGPDFWPIGSVATCTQNRGALDVTNNATPFNSDTRDLPFLDRFILARAVMVSKDGEEFRTASDIEDLEAKWRRMTSVHILLEIAQTNTRFFWNPQPFLEEGWLTEEDEWRALDPIRFRVEDDEDGAKVWYAELPLRKPVSLSELNN